MGVNNFSLNLGFPWVDVFCEEAFVKADVSLNEHFCCSMQGKCYNSQVCTDQFLGVFLGLLGNKTG